MRVLKYEQNKSLSLQMQTAINRKRQIFFQQIICQLLTRLTIGKIGELSRSGPHFSDVHLNGDSFILFNRRMKVRKQSQAYLPNRPKLTLKLQRNSHLGLEENYQQSAPIISINPAKISEKTPSPFKIRQINKEYSSKQLPSHRPQSPYPKKLLTMTPPADSPHQNMHKNQQGVRVPQRSVTKQTKNQSEGVEEIVVCENRKRASSYDNVSKSKISCHSDKQRKRSLDELMVFLHRLGLIDSAEQSFYMRKDKLFELFSGFRFHEKNSRTDKMGEMLKLLIRLSESKERIQINSQVFSLSLNSTVLESFSHFHFKAEKLMAQQIALSQSIATKQNILSALVSKIEERSEYLTNMKDQIGKLQEIFQLKKSNSIELQNRILGLTERLNQIQEEYNTIINYCERQDKNKILKIIVKQFKQIQSQIFEYAVYLQSNQMAHDISFEPKPFQEMERLILGNLQELSKQLMQNKTKTIERKCRQMSDFLHECIKKFQKKDVQIGKLSEFRTKCVHTFISKMKHWLANWELKQEYLVNLKKEFIANHKELFTILEAHLTQRNCKCHIQFQNAILILNRLWENFNYGNSFY